MVDDKSLQNKGHGQEVEDETSSKPTGNSR